MHIGNLLSVTASIHSFEKPGNPGQFDEYKYNTELGITAQGFAGKIEIKKNTVKNPEDFLHRLRNRFHDVVSLCCDEKTAGIVSAMVLGDKSGLSDEVKQLYQENGIAHVLAISGLHISLIGASLFCTAQIFYANAGGGRCNHGAFVSLWYFDRLFHFNTTGSYHDGMYALGKTCRKTL